MADEVSDDPKRTVLHAWHRDHGGKMVGFAGYDMPVQYSSGIIREHLATRGGAGLFDVSHMGRFRVVGGGAEAFLRAVLTNDARKLDRGHAQYTMIANPDGGAVDDAYLYKLADEDYVLVVNASNREKDWLWLREHAGTGPELVDCSEELGMVAVQGPASEGLLAGIFGAEALPERKRNRLTVARLDRRPIVIARTGYTGEPVCFELFPERDQTVAMWERLVELGATPVGLGARDSLRLEAGLPLYGHELGLDPHGNDIPIFANSLARFAVRSSNDDDYVGRDALVRQREEVARIRAGELEPRAREPILTHLVHPIAAFGSRRPLRAGYQVVQDTEPVGYVTSGMVVPYAKIADTETGAVSADEHDLRPIGLAMIDRRLQYRTDPPVNLDVVDARGNTIEVELVERNLRPRRHEQRS